MWAFLHLRHLLLRAIRNMTTNQKPELHEPIGRDFPTELYYLREKLRELHGATALQQYLRATLDHIVETRRCLVEDVRHAGSIIIAIIGGTAALWWVGNTVELPPLLGSYAATRVTVSVLCALIFLSVIPLYAAALLDAITAAYKLYVAAAVHSMMVHKALGMPLTHRWLWWADWENQQYLGYFLKPSQRGVLFRFWMWPFGGRSGRQRVAAKNFEAIFVAKGKCPAELASLEATLPQDIMQLEAAWCAYKPNLLASYSFLLHTFAKVSMLLGILCILAVF